MFRQMTGVLQIMVLEDRLADFELTRRHILKNMGDVLFTRAADEEEFITKIHQGSYDLILADYHLPGYNGLSALIYCRKYFPDLPFVFLTGALNDEESAASAILQGANGYVLKENLSHLHVHLQKVLADAAESAKAHKKRQTADAARQLKLRKAIGLLEQAGPFPSKSTITELLVSLLPEPAHKVVHGERG